MRNGRSGLFMTINWSLADLKSAPVQSQLESLMKYIRIREPLSDPWQQSSLRPETAEPFVGDHPATE
jgi:hypothetical protein